jgi:hypothetical protein
VRTLLRRGATALTVLLALSVGACGDILTGLGEHPSQTAPLGGGSPLFNTAVDPASDGFVRASSSQAVYLVLNRQMWLVPDPETMAKCYPRGWNIVRDVGQLPSLPYRGVVPSARTNPGYYSGQPVKTNDPSVQLVYHLSGCIKVAIPDVATYEGLYGTRDFGRVLWLPQSVINAFPTAPELASAPAYPPGTPIQGRGLGIRVVITPGRAIGVDRPCVFEGHGFTFRQVVRVSDAVFFRHAPTSLLHQISGFCGNGANASWGQVSYSADMAAQYARSHAFREFGGDLDQSPWPVPAAFEAGGRCTYFISSAVLGGFNHTLSAHESYKARENFLANQGSSGGWWFRNLDSRGKAFTGAQDFYNYIVGQSRNPSRLGLRAQFVTSHTNVRRNVFGQVIEGESRLWLAGITYGDLVFFDFTGDGSVDHVNIVTAINRNASEYDQIEVTGQSNPYVDRRLGELKRKYPGIHMYIYRPTAYAWK